MPNAQQAYWKRQSDAGKKKLTVVLSVEAQNILEHQKKKLHQSYSTIIENALISYNIETSSENGVEERLAMLENLVDDGLKKIELQLKENKNKIKENNKKTAVLEKKLIPKRKKKKTV